MVGCWRLIVFIGWIVCVGLFVVCLVWCVVRCWCRWLRWLCVCIVVCCLVLCWVVVVVFGCVFRLGWICGWWCGGCGIFLLGDGRFCCCWLCWWWCWLWLIVLVLVWCGSGLLWLGWVLSYCCCLVVFVVDCLVFVVVLGCDCGWWSVCDWFCRILILFVCCVLLLDGIFMVLFC